MLIFYKGISYYLLNEYFCAIFIINRQLVTTGMDPKRLKQLAKESLANYSTLFLIVDSIIRFFKTGSVF